MWLTELKLVQGISKFIKIDNTRWYVYEINLLYDAEITQLWKRPYKKTTYIKKRPTPGRLFYR